MHESSSPSGNGIIFAATGEIYVNLAQRAARTIREVMPDTPIDLFTDVPTGDSIFSQEHLLGDSFFRPKMEALRRSRFARTLYLDCDIVVLADVSELFDLLDVADISGALGVSREVIHIHPDSGLPRSAPLINSGVLAVRNTPETSALMDRWEKDVRERNMKIDQPVLRRLLYRTDLRFVVMPPEYNLKHTPLLDIWGGFMGAPRILHIGDLHQRPAGDPNTPFALEEVVTEERAAHIRRLIKCDWTLEGGDARKARFQTPNTRNARLVKTLRKLVPSWMAHQVLRRFG